MTTKQTNYPHWIRQFLISLLIVGSVILVIFRPLDSLGSQYLDSAFKQALASFAIARGLNGVISVAQGTEVAVQPAGVGINFTPGEILDPLNDLIERFSWIMLLSSSSIGIQKMLMSISSWPGLAAAFLLVSSLYLASLWWRNQSFDNSRRILSRLFIILLVLRFSVPLVAVVNEWVYQGFLHEQYSSATSELKKASDEISDINQETEVELPSTEEEAGIFDTARQMVDSAFGQMDIADKLERYKVAAEQVSENTIHLIVVYLLQTVLFPLLFLWALIRLLKRLLPTLL